MLLVLAVPVGCQYRVHLSFWVQFTYRAIFGVDIFSINADDQSFDMIALSHRTRSVLRLNLRLETSSC
jgi:hypothetical protein